VGGWVGPRTERPTRLDLAWHSTESNEVGLAEFAGWLEDAGSELMYWQLGHSSAEDYGKLASKTANAMRQLAPSVEPLVCGSSSA
jgi:alpha-L-arabinofuranosidase